MNFREHIIVTLLDKALIRGLIAIAGFWLNRGIERYKSRRALENELEKLRDQKENPIPGITVIAVLLASLSSASDGQCCL